MTVAGEVRARLSLRGFGIFKFTGRGFPLPGSRSLRGMAAPGLGGAGHWFGFGFNRFGQVINPGSRRECEADGWILEPRVVTACSPGPGQERVEAEAERQSPPPNDDPRGGGRSGPEGLQSNPRREGPGGRRCPAESAPVSKICPSWSHSTYLTDDGSVYSCGFVGGRPWHQICISNQGCTDILSSEKYLLMLWQDRVECWDIQNLCTEGTKGDVTWTRQLKEGERPCTALPLVPGGYVITVPPFYKPLSPMLCARKLVLGTEHALLLSFDWTVYSWGSGRHGQLGHGSVDNETEPRIVEALHGLAMAEVAVGAWHSHQETCTCGDGMSQDSWDCRQSHVQRRSIGSPLSRRGSPRVKTFVVSLLDIYWLPSGTSPKGSFLSLDRLPPTVSAASEAIKTLLPLELAIPSQNGTPTPSDAGDMITKSTSKEAAAGDLNVFISIQAFPALVDLPEELEVSKREVSSSHGAGVTMDNLAMDRLIVLIFQGLLSTSYKTIFPFWMLSVGRGTLLCLHNRKNFKLRMNCILSNCGICVFMIVWKSTTVA